MKKLFSVCIGLCLSLSASAAVEPRQVVEEIFTKASAPSVVSDRSLQEEINGKVNFTAMSKAVLGKESQKLPAAEFSWFDQTLKEIITRTVYPAAPSFLQDVKISYKDVDMKGAQAVVQSSVRNKADMTDVNYTLAKVNDGWQVVDISIDGESWVQSIREQVQATLKKQKWAGLKEKLNQRLLTLKSGK